MIALNPDINTTSAASAVDLVTAPAVRHLSDLEAEITTYLSESVIRHGILDGAYKRVQRLIERNRFLSEADHAAIVGESGCGKSTLCDLIEAEYGPVETGFRLGVRLKQPVVSCSIQSPVTVRSLPRSVLNAMGDYAGTNTPSHQLTERLIYLIKTCETQLIIFDEAQDLLTLGGRVAEGMSKSLARASNWIKTLINRAKVTVILMGLPRTIDLINTDEQLARRFKSTFHLRPFAPPTENDTLVEFVDELLLHLLVEIDYFTNFSEFARDRNYANQLYLATGGSPARVKVIAIDAACLAARAQDHVITPAHFQQAFISTAETNSRILGACAHNREMRASLDRVHDGKAVNPFALPTAEVDQLIGIARM